MLPEIDSTNTELMRRARAGQCDPVLLVAEQQTAGGAAWAALAQCGGRLLTFSLGLPLAPQDWSGLSLAVGVSVAESLQPPPFARCGQQGTPRIGAKWPNDLWLGGAQGDRKLGGILRETASLCGARLPVRLPRPPTAAATWSSAWGWNVLPQRRWRACRCRRAACKRWSLAWMRPRRCCGWCRLASMLGLLPCMVLRPCSRALACAMRSQVWRAAPVQLSDGIARRGPWRGRGWRTAVHTARGMQAVTSAEISVRPCVLEPFLPPACCVWTVIVLCWPMLAITRPVPGPSAPIGVS